MTVSAYSIVQYIIQIKNYHKSKKSYSLNPTTCIFKNSKYLKTIADTSVAECNEIIISMDIVSTKKANTILTNVTSTASTNCKEVRDGCILDKVLLAIILLLRNVIICYYYAKQK